MNFATTFVVYVTARTSSGFWKILLTVSSGTPLGFLNVIGHSKRFCFTTCMYGGLRPKRTGLLANFDISSLEAICDDSHDHAPWRSISHDEVQFHTSEEAAYPPQFCRAVASLIAEIAVREGFALPPTNLFDFDAPDTLLTKHLLRGSVGIQPRGAQFSFLPFLLMNIGCHKMIFQNIAFQIKSFLFHFLRGQFFPLSSSLMMGHVQELNSIHLRKTRGR